MSRKTSINIFSVFISHLYQVAVGFIIAGCIMSFSVNSQAANKKWTGNVDSNWENPLNWSGATLPVNGNKIFIDSVANYSGAKAHPIISVNSSFIPSNIDVENGGKLFIQANLTTSGNVTVDNGNSTSYSSKIDMSIGVLIINSNKNLQAKKGGVINFTGGTIIVTKDVNIDEGIFNMNENNGTSTLVINSDGNGKGKLKVKCNNTANGLFKLGAGTVTINAGDVRGLELDGKGKSGATNARIDISGGIFINNSTTQLKNSIGDSTLINISGGDVTLAGNVGVKPGSGEMDINISGGTLTFRGNLTMEAQDLFTQSGGSTVKFQGTNNWTNDGIFNSMDGAVIFEGSTSLLGATGSWQFNNLEITGGASFAQTIPANINLSGNWTNAGGAFFHSGRMVTFDGTSVQTISNTTAGGETFNDLVTTIGSVVNVPAGVIVNVIGTITNSGTLDNDGTLKLTNGYAGNTGILSGDGTHTLTGGNWNNTGTFNAEGSTVFFSGSAPQTIQGISTFNNITIDNGSGVSIIADAHNLTNTLTLTSGTFNTNNALTLLSTGSGTARIAEITGGSITGNITMERYIDGTYGWKLLGSAVSGQTIGDWDDDIYMSGVNGIDGNACCPIWYSVYTYDETPLGPFQDFGWVEVTDTSTAIGVGQGFWAYVMPLPEMIRVEGPPNTFFTNIPVTYSSSGVPPDDGWNLVSNPYPSDISWDDPGWTKTNMANAIYIWDHSIPGWASYVGGFGANGGSQYIASSQGFLVQAFAASPTLAVTEPVKSSANPSFFKTTPAPQNFFRLKAEGNNKTDEIVFYFDAAATSAFDYSTDARDLYADWPEGIPNFSSISSDNLDLSINGLPELTQDIVIPLRLFTNISGNHTISLEEINMPQTSCLVLEDTYNSTFTDLKNNSYAFFLNDTTQAPRFLLHITAPIAKEVVDVSCHAANDGLAIAKGSGNGPWDYVWKDAQDNVLQTTINSNAADTLSALAPGVYTISIINYTGVCSNVSDAMVVNEPDELLLILDAKEVSCYGLADGQIDLSISGGTLPYSILWSNGESVNFIDNLTPGSYDVTITDNNGCVELTNVTITEPKLIIPEFNISADTLYLSSGATVFFSNTSSGSDTYYWEFGDGSFSTLSNPVHTYYEQGVFTVTMNAAKGFCQQTSNAAIIVLDALPAFDAINYSDKIDIRKLGEDILITFNFDEQTQVRMSFLNILGQEIYPSQEYKVLQETVTLRVPVSGFGIYLIRAETDHLQLTKKIILE